jgi:hypothetical protein
MSRIHSRVLSCILAAFALLFGGSVHAQLSDVTQPGDLIVPTSNNSPGSEGVANAINNTDSKYLNFDRVNTGFTVTPSVGMSVVQCLTLKSANDAPDRDPANYVLSGSYDGVNFTEISSGAVPAFASRFDKVVIRFENNTPYLQYRLIFPTTTGPSTCCMQIAEVELLGFLAPSDVTQPGDPIVATSNNSPGSEGVANAINNTDSKYLNFDRVDTGFTVSPSVGPTLVTGLSLKSANDAPDRDPATYRLEGSLDGVSFFEISSGNVPAFPTRFFKNYIFFPNSRAFLAYRLIFPITTGPSTCCMQIAEVELLGSAADLAQDVTQPGDLIVPTSNNSPGSEGVANAINNTDSKYLNFDRVNTGFTVSPSAGLTIVSGLTLKSANDAPDRDPANYTLEGSYDNVNFTAISSGSVPAFPTRFHKNTILFNNKVPYVHYRLIFPLTTGPSSCCMQIAEVELLGTLAPTDVTVPGDPIVATSNNSPGSEGVANAINNTDSKYLNFDRVNTGFTVTPGVGDTIVTGLTLKSANDAPDRDPANYTLEGSNDGVEFVPISSGNVPPFPTRFFKNYIFFPENTKSFKSYRLIFPLTTGPSTCCMQIAEVEFLGVTPGVVNTNIVDSLIRRQPQDTPVLLGQSATLRVVLTGPWRVQWYKNGASIPGASSAVYVTPPTTAGDDGSRFYAVVQGRDGRQISDEVMLSIFTPSATQSVGWSFEGSGANGAPTAMLPTDITGFHPQAYWNNITDPSGGPAIPTTSDNSPHPTVTIQWATSGEWGSGTGNGDPLERMLNGMATSFSTTEAGAQSITLAGLPPGSHSVFLYTVQVPQEFFNMDFIVSAGGVDQRRYIRPLNSDEYNPIPGFSLVTADTAASRGVGNFMRFDNLSPGVDGTITIRFFSPGRVDLPGGDPIRGPGINGLQLILNPPDAGAPPVITQQPASANGIAGGCVILTVEATGPGISYQWLKNGSEIAGATSPQLILSGLTAGSAGSYSVVVSNPAGRSRSRNAVVQVLASAQLNAGLITYYKLDEVDGRTAANSAAGGLPAELRDGFELWEPGQVANSLYFEGNIYAYTPNYPKVSGAMTVASWVKSTLPNWGPIVNNWVEGQTTGASGQFVLDVFDDAGVPTLRGQIEVGPNRVLATAPIDGSLGVWHHVAMTANGGTLSLYWDGRLVATADYLGSINATPSIPWLVIALDPLAVDGSIAPTARYLTGGLDDLAIWNRSLSEVEISGIYNGGLSGRSIGDTPPILVAGDCRPTINCPNPITVECAGGLTPVTFEVSGADAAGNPLTATCVPPSGSGFQLGQTTVTCTVTAGPGNTASCSFRVTVVDTTPPTVTCPGNITADATSPAGATVPYSVSAFDACGIRSLVCTPPGSDFPVGTTSVTCVGTDSVGNSNSCTFTVTVRPFGQPPNAVISSEQLIDLSPEYENPVLLSCNWWNACLVADGWTSTGVEPLSYLWSLEGDPVPFGAGPLVTNCLEVGDHTILLTVTDANGLSDTDTKTISIVTAPLAIELLIEQVDTAHKHGVLITRKLKRELIATLRIALGHAGDEELRATQKALDAFEKKVRANVREIGEEAATAWIRWSQAVSEGMEKCIKPPRKAKDHHDDKKDDDKKR